MVEQQSKIQLSDLTPVEFNHRTITSEEMVHLRESIIEGTKACADWNPGDGFRLNGTILVNRQGMRVVAGNQRVRALQLMGQDWIHVEDITFIDVEPDSPAEKERSITLNNPKVAGDFTAEMAGLLREIESDYSDVDLGLAQLQAELQKQFADVLDNPPEPSEPTPKPPSSPKEEEELVNLVLYIPKDKFSEVQKQLDEIGATEGFSTNTESFLFVLAQHFMNKEG